MRLFDGHGEATDAYALEVGIRTIEVQGDRLLLNGKPIFLKGFGKHEDFPIHGRGLALPVLVRDHGPATAFQVGAGGFLIAALLVLTLGVETRGKVLEAVSR